MAQAPRDQNRVTTLLGVSNADGTTPVVLWADPVTHRLLVDIPGTTGTVTDVSVVTANGFAGTVATSTTTPAITLSTTVTGVLKGNGTAISAAAAGTDYQAPITLTTTGSSGVATFIANTLNIPNYSFTNATTVTVANEATDTTCFPLFVTAATGDLGPKSNTNLTFNSNTGLLGASAFTATGTITGGTVVPTSSSAPPNGLYLPAANTLGWAVNSAAEMQLTGTALSPAADGGLSLGTTALGFQNLFGNTGFVFNIENGDWVATHTSGILTVGTGDLRVTNAGTNSASAVTVGGTQTLTAKTLTSPTITTANLSGSQLLAEGASIALDPSLSADGTWSGITMTATAGYTQAFGDLVYLDPTDSRWEAVDANSAAGADGDARGMLGMVVVAGTDGNACTVLLQGVIRADAKFPTFTINNPIYVSETAGSVTQTQPTTTDVVIRIIGAAITADAMYFDPDKTWITHT